MNFRLIAPLSALALSACATVTDETRTLAVIPDGFNAGERYEIRQQLLEGPTGTYETSSVVYRGIARGCIIDSPGDCESQARRLIDEYNDRFLP